MMEKPTVVEVLKFIEESDTPFIYPIYNDSYLRPVISNSKVSISKDEIMTLCFQGHITTSDKYILLAIAKLNIATRPMIMEQLKYISKFYNPEHAKPIPVDPDGVKARLNALADYGLFRKMQYKMSDTSKSQSYYCLTAHGYAIIKLAFNFNDAYNDYVAITPLHDVVKQLAVNEAMLSVIDSPNLLKLSSTSYVYGKGIGKAMQYGFMETMVNGKHFNIMFEPLFFRVDNALLSKDEVESEFKRRNEAIKSFISLSISASREPIIVILFETPDSFKKLSAYYRKNYESILQYAYFGTSKSILNYGYGYGLFRIYEKDGNAMFNVNMGEKFV